MFNYLLLFHKKKIKLFNLSTGKNIRSVGRLYQTKYTISFPKFGNATEDGIHKIKSLLTVMVNCQQNSCCFVADSKQLVMVMDHIFQVDHVTNVVASQIHYHQPSKKIQSRPHISQNICAVINSYVLHSTINRIGHCDKI